MSVTSKVGEKRPKRKGKKKLVSRKARDAKMAVSFAPVQIKPPHKKNGNHGNTPLAGEPGKYERIACVLYYRERMVACKDPQGELDHARRRSEGGGGAIWDPEELEIVEQLRSQEEE